MFISLPKNKSTYSTIIIILSVAYGLYEFYKADNTRKSLEAWSDVNKKVLTNESTTLEEFKNVFNQTEWDFLMLKLDNSRYFKSLKDKDVKLHEIGFDPEYAEEMVNYWKNDFNWKKSIDNMNKYPQFKLVIDKEITIHYLRVITNQNSTIKPIKLLLINGWPEAFFCFYKMIDQIALNYNHSFDIIVPTIPGFGYSTPLVITIDVVDTAKYFDALMRFVNKDENCEYFIHGEGWGSAIATNLAKMYPSRVKGIHLTVPVIELNYMTLIHAIISQISPRLIMTQEEIQANLTASFDKPDFFQGLFQKTGYLHYQATRPDTIAHGLSDSPVGLLAYILEAYAFGSYSTNVIGHKDALLHNYNKDDLLSIVTYYWMTNSISSSIRLYRSYFMGKPNAYLNVKLTSKVAVGIQYFKNEIYVYPLCLLRSYFMNVKSFTIEDKGGHFAAFENPDLTAKDFINLVVS